MKTIVHLLKKDLTRYAWAIVLLALLGAIEIYLHGTDAGLLETPANQILTSLVMIVGPILFFIVIVMVVQEETLADPDAYWLARPISRGSLLAEKMIFVLLLILVGTVSEAVVLILNGGSSRLGFALLGVIPALAMWNWQIFLAAQTRSLARYLLLAVSIFVGFYGLMFASIFLARAIPFSLIEQIALLPRTTPRHLLILIQSVFWLSAGIGILLHLYRTRRILRSWLLLAGALLGSAILSPSDSMFGLAGYTDPSHRSERLKLDHIRLPNPFQVNGEDYVECEAVLDSNDASLAPDARVTIVSSQLNSGGATYPFESKPFSQKQMAGPDGKRTISLGTMKRSELDKITSPIELLAHYEITLSTEIESGRLDLHRGSGYHGNGDRLAVRSASLAERRLHVTLAGVVAKHGWEPKQVESRSEAYDGRFSFTLVRKDGSGTPSDFRIPSFQTSLGTIREATSEATLPEGAKLDDYEIVVHTRQLIQNSHDFIHTKEVKLVKP
jgi:hypothetical protein